MIPSVLKDLTFATVRGVRKKPAWVLRCSLEPGCLLPVQVKQCKKAQDSVELPGLPGFGTWHLLRFPCPAFWPREGVKRWRKQDFALGVP